MIMEAKNKRQLIWIALGILAVGLRLLGKGFPSAVEILYSRGLFLGVRWSIDYLLAWLPFPLIYPFVIILGWGLIRSSIRFFRRRDPWRRKFIQASLGIASFLGGAAFFFLFLWGYNYSRVSIERQLGIEPVPLSVDELYAELAGTTDTLIRWRARIPGITDSAFTADLLPPNLEREVRKDLERWLDEHGFPTVGRVRGRFLYPRGIFLRFSSAGLYWPFTGEGHIDAGLHPVVYPHVLSHEMSHGYGFGDEGTCNFLAYLATTGSTHPANAYSGLLDYWQTLAINCRRYDPERYEVFRKSIPQGIRSDIQAIYQNNRAYPDIIPHYRQLVIDPYLKSQGVKEGIKSYDRVIMLVRAWKGREGGNE
jgi:hypothetical protein